MHVVWMRDRINRPKLFANTRDSKMGEAQKSKATKIFHSNT